MSTSTTPTSAGARRWRTTCSTSAPTTARASGTGVAENSRAATHTASRRRCGPLGQHAELLGCGRPRRGLGQRHQLGCGPPRPVAACGAVISHSWPGAGYFGLFNELAQAVNNLSQHNVFVAVAAGNGRSGGDLLVRPVLGQGRPRGAAVRGREPARERRTGTDRHGQRPERHRPAGRRRHAGLRTLPDTYKGWSTVGGDVYAPGFPVKTIKELPNAHNSPFVTDCGTSYAAPMAAGVAALYKATYGETPSPTVKEWIIAHATPGAITNNPPQEGNEANTFTPNRLLNTGGL
ncbi:S8 family serine peptidase [Yinghuangia aomiensis]